jgi:hypothetical protein
MVDATLDRTTLSLVPLFEDEGHKLPLNRFGPQFGDYYVTVRRSLTTREQREIDRCRLYVRRFWERVKEARERDEQPPLPDDDYYRALNTFPTFYVTAETNLTKHPRTGEPLPPPTDPEFWSYFDDKVRQGVDTYYWEKVTEESDGTLGGDFTKPASGT